MSEYKEVERQITLGNLWRAKEILQGRLAGSKYDAELYERYGQVLLQMHDELEAGKFLFLSGQRESKYEKAISLYLDRYAGKSTGGLFHTFPHSAQVSSIEKFPETVLSVLEKSGHSRNAIKGKTRPKDESQESNSFLNHLVFWFIIVIFVVILGGLLVQGIRGIAWVIQWLF